MASVDERAVEQKFGLSSRGAHNHLHKRAWEFFEKCLATPWTPENPDGVINLGVAENAMMHGEVSKFIEQNTKVDPTSHLTYGYGPRGSPRLKKTLASFLNSNFNPRETVQHDDILIMAGVTPIIDALAWTLCNEGEGIIIPQPFYAAFATDIPTRARGVIISALFQSLEGYTGFDDVFDAEMNKKALAVALARAKSQGVTVKAVLLTHPHNPLGRCYEVATFCGQNNLHLISDEIYANSVFANPQAPDAIPFTSILSLDLSDRIDRERVHVAYGASKDFCANGLRLGMLYTRSEGLMGAIASNTMLGWPPYIVQDIWAAMLENEEYTKSFLSKNQALLAEQYGIATKWLEENGIPYFRGSNAGMFLWIDLRRYLCGSSENIPELRIQQLSDPDAEKYLQREMEICNLLAKHGVLLASGTAFYTEEMGWFRLTFTPTRGALVLGLQRLGRALKELESAS
ncbi:putative 1-aminocyclopropane-1-carboxylate synthase [Podospora australis]|uniref:1-aminocyclopropane-1-carboxylate synthase n=1 Tax=Podospora australis TaxID=1536484 RepID=A0AAN6WZS7_9PEZI|nr:putative 1-aminocyclopropane-1-carboxylate synthase [Podospora australis]